ncbi:MAG: hypothetical protein Q4A55_07780 [Aerococcus sp.]|nr:hypothetical protein [Aerococcus sp.]
MDWEKKRQDHHQHECFVPFYEEDEIVSRPQKRREKRDFPNYLNPQRQVKPENNAPPYQEDQMPSAKHTPTHGGGRFDVTWKRPDKEAYYQQLRQELADYQVYRSRQPFKSSSVPSIWQHDEKHTPKQEEGYTPAIRETHEQPIMPTHTEQPVAPQKKPTETKPKRGLNMNLSEIMAHERPVSGQPFLSHDDHSTVKHQPPYLKKAMNGEENKDE